MTDTVDLAALDEGEFENFYRKRIEPALEGKEEMRQAALKKFWSRMWTAIPIALCIGAGVFLITGGDFIPALMAVFFATLLGYVIAYMPLSRVAKAVKGKSMDALAAAIGCHYQHEGFHPVALDRFRHYRLLPGSDRESFEDYFRGMRHGCGFDLYEAHLEDERRDKDGDTDWVTVFRGQLIQIEFPKKFLGITIVRRDSGIFNVFGGMENMQRVGLSDLRFERAFEVYSTDQVEARYLVHPVFMERLLELEETFKGKALRCCFQAGYLILALEGGNKFEAGDMFKPISDPDRAKTFVREIAQILKLIDAVLTAEQGPLIAREGKSS
jgi:hypothetical protein